MSGRGDGWARRFWDRAYRDGDHLRHWEDSARAAGRRVAALGGAAAGEAVVPGAGDGGAGGGIILDLGCGGGHELIALGRRGVFAAGLDLSLSALAVARSRGRRADLALALGCGDVTRLPLADGCVRQAIDRGCFHQLGGPARRRYGAEVGRVLAAGGSLVLWGARDSSEEEGLVGLGPAVLAAAFPAVRFHVETAEPVTLSAPAGDLPGLRVAVHRRSRPRSDY